jgi:ribonuclease BN (tRNA processing enzyme)
MKISQLSVMVLMSFVFSTACSTYDTKYSVTEVAKVTNRDVAKYGNEWITLGTIAGPVPSPTHSQPSNALVVGDNIYIVDAGDGTVGQLTRAGESMRKVDAVFLSHLHFDHTAGLAGIIALRWQTNAPNMLTVYGPPGTKKTVEGLFAFMEHSTEGHFGVPGQKTAPANRNVQIVEITDGSVIELEDFKFTSVSNSHFSWPEGSKEWEKFKSLSFKFELADRTIIYTGDTGPSDAVVELAKGADLYISEMMDANPIVERIKKMNPNMPDIAVKNMKKHIEDHHVNTEQVADMATRAGVKRVVITHMSPRDLGPAKMAEYVEEVKAGYEGDVVMANDLDRF